jgi:hemerythrin-like metal-binding protein
MNTSKNTILIIDDNTINVEVLKSTLKIHGFESISAYNGTQGIEQAQLYQPDLILLDILMPNMDGYEVCERLKADESTKDIPVIFISALDETFDKVKAFKIGAVDYMTKPFQNQEVLARITTHLKLRDSQQALQQKVLECQQAEEKIQHHHQFLQQVINSLEHPFYVINATTYQIELANSFMHQLGFQPQITCHVLTHKSPTPCTGTYDPCPLEQVKRTKKPVIVEHIHFDKEGHPINVEVHGFPIFDAQGNVSKMIEYSLDITERKLAEKKLKEQNKQLQIKNDQLDAFATQLEALQEAKLYQLNQAYERFVPHQFLSLLGKKHITEIQLGDQIEQEMTILFADIREFTTISETMTPQENFNFINSFLSQMEPVIRKHQGFIDKYLGDGIMALFTKVEDAIQTGIAMLTTLQNYNKNRQKVGYRPIEIGIGINTGLLMLGIIGGNKRMDSTVISDAVNIASRLESLTKVYRTPLLISEASHRKLTPVAKAQIRLLDQVKVKGKFNSVNVFEVFTADPPTLRSGKQITLEQFETAVHLYQQQNFTEAQDLFQACLSQNPTDATAEVYIKRCQQFLNIDTNTRWKDIATTICWTPKLSVHHDLIDQQHQELFVRIKDLIMSIGNGESGSEVIKVINFLKEYVVVHFATEEQLMQQYNYVNYLVHKAQHTHFIQRVAQLENDYNRRGGRLYLTLQIQEEVVDWLINHIAKLDKQLASFLHGQIK